MSILSRACAGPVVVMVLLGGLPVAAAHAAEPSYSILHSFQGAESNPHASLISDGNGSLYGTTAHGGSSDGGTVFTVRTDGTGFERLHTFTGGASDGLHPEASLVLDESGNLYGTTARGGTSDGGIAFALRAHGGGFQVLHSFMGGANDGQLPFASLTLDGTGNLYGTTLNGGPSNAGIVFKLKTDGASFQILHSFAGGLGDGQGPQASLLLDESGYLYGTTAWGGQEASFGAGTIFRIKTDATGFQVLHAFSLDAKDGAYPSGALITDGSGILYGMTAGGGSSNAGTVFKVAKDSSGFEILHSFKAGANDERNPVGSLVLDRSGNLYGMTQGEVTEQIGFGGGLTTVGPAATIFRIRTDAAGYEVLHSFVDPLDGKGPTGSLVLDSRETLYGTLAYAGSSNAGTFFSVDTDGTLFQVQHSFAGFMDDGAIPWASVIPDGAGYLYGTTSSGAYKGSVFRIRADGTGLQLLHAFIGGANDGAEPHCPLVLDRAGNLYGTTSLGGSSNRGTVFKVRTDGTGFQLLHTFVGGSDGLDPLAALILDRADNLYGTTADGGGPTDAGTIFRLKTDGTGYQLLHTFDALSSEGAGPYASLLPDGSGNLYGTTMYLGGTVFKLRTDGTGFQVLRSFTGGADDGSEPWAALSMDGSGNLYGTTARGGPSDVGTVFKMKTDGTSFQLLHSFAQDASDGVGPLASVILDGLGNLYGTTSSGGQSRAGTVFTVRTDGTAHRILHSFGEDPGDGRNPFASLFMDGSGNLIGTTQHGGTTNFGTVFALSVGRHHAVVTPGPFVPVPVRRR